MRRLLITSALCLVPFIAQAASTTTAQPTTVDRAKIEAEYKAAVAAANKAIADAKAAAAKIEADYKAKAAKEANAIPTAPVATQPTSNRPTAVSGQVEAVLGKLVNYASAVAPLAKTLASTRFECFKTRILCRSQCMARVGILLLV